MRNARINANRPQLWKTDIAASVDQFNQWFMRFAPEAFRSTRFTTTEHVKTALLATRDLRSLDTATLKTNPGALPTLRMCTAPPLAVDRLVGLSGANKSLIGCMEEGKLSSRMKAELLDENLSKVSRVLLKLLDRDIFPWLDAGTVPTDHERDRASTIVADRLCSAVAQNLLKIIRRQHQLRNLRSILDSMGYRRVIDPNDAGLNGKSGSYRENVSVPLAMGRDALLPTDVIVQPTRLSKPVILQIESFWNHHDGARRMRRAVKKYRAFRRTYGSSFSFILFLGGIVDVGALGRIAAESLDWVWQHRIGQLVHIVSRGRSQVRI